ncbi:MAG TPA: methyltransferase domain-containing protein [Burkholderiales bacterium]
MGHLLRRRCRRRPPLSNLLAYLYNDPPMIYPSPSARIFVPDPTPPSSFQPTPGEKRQLRRQRDRAVATFDAAAVLSRRLADELIERLDVVRMVPARILDAGSGTGYAARALRRRYRGAAVFGLDPSPAMAAAARRKAGWFARPRFTAGDPERLPFPDGSFDLVLSNLLLPWYDPAAVFPEFLRVLRPDGLFVFSSLGPDTLRELREAWAAVDDTVHVRTFLDMHDVGDALVYAGFSNPVMDVERYVYTYADVRDVLRELKALGAQNIERDRRRSLTGRARFARFEAAYALRKIDGRIPATVEVVYGHAWVPKRRRVPGAAAAAIPVGGIRRGR